MLETIQSLSLLTLGTFVSATIFAIALVYGIMHSRRKRSMEAASAAKTEQLYQSEQK